MKYKIERLTNDKKHLLIEFEKRIRQTEPDIWLEQFNAEDYQQKLALCDFDSSNNMIFCILRKNAIVARCDLIIQESYSDFEKTGYIDWIYVEKNNRSNGFAKLLINEALEKIKTLGVTYCYLFTAKNDEAQAFYKSLETLDIEKKEIAHKHFK